MHMKYPRTGSGDDRVRGMFVLVVEISEKSISLLRLCHAVDGFGKTGNFAGSGILVEDTFALRLVDRGRGVLERFGGSCLIAGGDRCVDLLDSGLHCRLDHLIAKGLFLDN